MIINESTLLLTLSVPASPDQLHVLRAATRAVIAHQALTVDDLTDLVLAVDEAATTLLNHARTSGYLTCIFKIDSQRHLRVHLSTTTTESINIATTALSWVALQALVDDLTLEHTPPAHQDENWTATINLKKSLPAAA